VAIIYSQNLIKTFIFDKCFIIISSRFTYEKTPKMFGLLSDVVMKIYFHTPQQQPSPFWQESIYLRIEK